MVEGKREVVKREKKREKGKTEGKERGVERKTERKKKKEFNFTLRNSASNVPSQSTPS